MRLAICVPPYITRKLIPAGLLQPVSTMVSSKHLLTLCIGAVLQALSVQSRVDKRGHVCTVVPERNGHDDSPSIVSAFTQCKQDASVVFLNETYHVERVLSTHGLRNVTVDIRGTLLVRSQRMHPRSSYSGLQLLANSGARTRRIGSTTVCHSATRTRALPGTSAETTSSGVATGTGPSTGTVRHGEPYVFRLFLTLGGLGIHAMML